MTGNHLDVIIVGAGLSGIGAGYHLQTQCPGKRYLILDRDPLYTAAFRRMLKDSGVKVVRLPPKSPNLNAFIERFIR